MVVRSWLVRLGAALAVLAGIVVAAPSATALDASLPCDIYGAAGTPCVAAHSTTRALFGATTARSTR